MPHCHLNSARRSGVGTGCFFSKFYSLKGVQFRLTTYSNYCHKRCVNSAYGTHAAYRQLIISPLLTSQSSLNHYKSQCTHTCTRLLWVV